MNIIICENHGDIYAKPIIDSMLSTLSTRFNTLYVEGNCKSHKETESFSKDFLSGKVNFPKDVLQRYDYIYKKSVDSTNNMSIADGEFIENFANGGCAIMDYVIEKSVITNGFNCYQERDVDNKLSSRIRSVFMQEEMKALDKPFVAIMGATHCHDLQISETNDLQLQYVYPYSKNTGSWINFYKHVYGVSEEDMEKVHAQFCLENECNVVIEQLIHEHMEL